MAETKAFRLPDLGEGLTDAEIVRWLVAEGDTVELNQPIVEVETEKALVEIPSPFAGVVETLHGDVGARIDVGSPLVSIKTESDGSEAPAEAGDGKSSRREVLVGYGPEEGGGKRRRRGKIGRREAEAPAAEAPAKPAGALATPPVRKLAKEMGVEIDSVRGTGKDGRVTREDVVAASQGAGRAPAAAAVSAVPAAPRRLVEIDGPEEERIAVRSIRRTIAERMVRSYTEIPHVTEWMQADATELMRVRAEMQKAPEAEGLKVSPLAIITKALVAALRNHPLINSSWSSETNEIVVKRRYHIGIAADTDRGLLVPVVRDADRLSVFELTVEIARLVAAARDGSIGPAELGGSTITITNVGSFGMESGTPIINHPEAAILCLGAIVKRPWVLDGQIVPRDIVTLALSFDHRIIDGAEAGRFLKDLADFVERPNRLFGVL